MLLEQSSSHSTMTSARTKTENHSFWTRASLPLCYGACCELLDNRIIMALKKYNFKSDNIYSNCTGIKIEIIHFLFLVTCERLVHNTSGSKNLFGTEGTTYLNIAFPVSTDHTGVTHSGHRKLVSCNCEQQICEACRL